MLFSTWVDALKYCCPVLASETDISLVFNYFFTQNVLKIMVLTLTEVEISQKYMLCFNI